MGTTLDWLQNSYDESPFTEFIQEGKCHDCGRDVKIVITINPDSDMVTVSGGGIWKIKGINNLFFKCDACFQQKKELTDFRPCEVWSRVVGYLRPVKQWNPGKQAEFRKRKTFSVG